MAATPFRNSAGISRTVLFLAVLFSLCLGFYAGSFVTALYAPSNSAKDAPGRIPPELAAELRRLEALTRREPQNAAAWTNLGNLNYDLHRHEEAIAAYEAALRLSPGVPDVLVDLGGMYRAVGQPRKAVACFDRALAVRGTHQFALLNKGIVLHYDLGQTLEAKEVWQTLLRINPDASLGDGTKLGELLKGL